MQTVTVYLTQFCPYCTMARSLLAKKGVPVVEIDVAFDPQRRAEMQKRANGRRTVPQIFVGSTHIGGCDDLYALERAGRLDDLLKDDAA